MNVRRDSSTTRAPLEHRSAETGAEKTKPEPPGIGRALGTGAAGAMMVDRGGNTPERKSDSAGAGLPLMSAPVTHTRAILGDHTMRRTISNVATTLALTALVTTACSKKLREYGEVDGDGGNSGNPGKSEGGQGGDGDPGQRETLSVVDVTPPSGAIDVERDVPIVVTFSAAVDPESVTTSAFEVVGVNGPIAGTLTVEDEVITFRPERRWHLHSEVTVKVSTDLKGSRGERLAEGAESSFFVRDGEFGVPALLSPDTSVNVVSAGNKAGDVIVAWQDAESTHIAVTVFDAAVGSWTEVVELSNGAVNWRPQVAINALGDALAVWDDGATASTAAGWSRYSRESGWSAPKTLDRTAHPGSAIAVALADDGLAVGLWGQSNGDEWDLWSSWLNDDWSTPTRVHGASGYPQALVAGNEFLAVTQRSSDDAYVVRVAPPNGNWATSTVFEGQPRVVADDEVALATVVSNNVLKVSRYVEKVWSEPIEVGEATPPFHEASVMATHAMATWLTATGAVRCSITQGDDWSDSVDLGTAEVYPPPTSVLDRAGNAIVFWSTEGNAWPTGESMTWRRYRDGFGWSSPRTLPYAAEGVRAFADSEGNVIAVFMNEDGVWHSRFE